MGSVAHQKRSPSNRWALEVPKIEKSKHETISRTLVLPNFRYSEHPLYRTSHKFNTCHSIYPLASTFTIPNIRNTIHSLYQMFTIMQSHNTESILHSHATSQVLRRADIFVTRAQIFAPATQFY